jgi:hypothetical protein
LKYLPGDYLVKLVERMPRVCKAVIKAKGGNFLFVYYMIPYMLFHSVDVLTIILQCRKKEKKERKTLD